VWWVEFDELRPVVVLGGDEASGFQVIQVVPSADMDISGLGVEVPIGPVDGLAHEGVLRLGFPNPDLLFCTWLTAVPARSLVKRAGALSPAKIDEIDAALLLCSQPREPAPDATARLGEIRDALRRGEARGTGVSAEAGARGAAGQPQWLQPLVQEDPL
jgi:mRNA interferase MazF